MMQRDPAASNPDDHVRSPCIRVCALDAARTHCTGCLRTLDEITRWGLMNGDEKRAVLAALPARSTPQRRFRLF